MPGAGQTALTVVGDGQAHGVAFPGHHDVDACRVAGMTLGVGDRLLRDPEQRRLHRGPQILEITATLHVDPQAGSPLAGRQTVDVVDAPRGAGLGGPVIAAQGPDHGAHLGQRARGLLLDDFEGFGRAVRVA